MRDRLQVLIISDDSSLRGRLLSLLSLSVPTHAIRSVSPKEDVQGYITSQRLQAPTTQHVIVTSEPSSIKQSLEEQLSHLKLKHVPEQLEDGWYLELSQDKTYPTARYGMKGSVLDAVANSRFQRALKVASDRNVARKFSCRGRCLRLPYRRYEATNRSRAVNR